MFKTYYYFNNEKYPIKVSQETCEITPYTFQKDGLMWENKSLEQFFNGIDKYKKVNIVDIGAQSGLYSLYAKYLPYSTFYAFEPFPISFKLLQDNIALNKLTNVNTYNLALLDRNGTLILNTSESHNGLHTVGKNPLRFNDIKQIEIESTTLDDMFFKKDIPVDYIKIDTEGAEYFILKGGKETIKKYKPIIQLEWNYTNMKQCDVSEQMMNDLIKEIEYKEIAFVEEEKLIGPL